MVNECEASSNCICLSERKVILDNDPECSVICLSGVFDESIKEFTAYCSDYQSGKERELNRAKRQREAAGKHSENDLAEIAKLQEYSCYFCRKQLYAPCEIGDMSKLGTQCHWDHLLPLSRGGSNFPSNMALTCTMCNLKKGRKTEDEFWDLLRDEMVFSKIVEVREFHNSYSLQKRDLDIPYK